MSIYFKEECNNDFLKTIAKYMPQIGGELKAADDNTVKNLKYIEKTYNLELPETFEDLYSIYDGEDDKKFLGTILGFSLMNSYKILDNIKGFNEMDFDFVSMKTDYIKDGDLKNKIPFAFDGSRCFIALDMDPGNLGRKGQVITIDFDYDQYYLLADSLEEFYSFIKKMLHLEKCTIETNEECEQFFVFESGHLFNKLSEILDDNKGEEEFVAVNDEMWLKYFASDIEDNKISSKILAKEKRVMLKNEEGSLQLLKYMTGLREIIIHNSKIEDFKEICEAKELRKLYLVNCDFKKEELKAVEHLPHLNEISLNKMALDSIKDLSSIKSLKDLSLNKIEGLDYHELNKFKSLKNLEIEDNHLKDYSFLKGMNSLESLDITSLHPCEDLDFLKDLKKLKKFDMSMAAKNEDGLKFISTLKKLKEFNYPVKDMTFYKDCASIKHIGLDLKNVINIESLQGSNINGVTFYNVDEDEEVKVMAEKLKEYINLTSWSYSGRS